MNSRTLYETISVVLSGTAGFLFGAADGLFYALVAFVTLDYITGITDAIHKKRLSSRIGFSGICKKVMIFILVALANIIDVQVIGNNGGDGVLRSATIGLFLANEGLSIIENAAGSGLPVPRALMKFLAQLKNNRNNNNDKTEDS